eukprot:3738726-Rhodomonas_salina.1
MRKRGGDGAAAGQVEEEGGVRESVTRRLSKLNEEHHFTDKLAEVRAKTSAAATQVRALMGVRQLCGRAADRDVEMV